MFSPQRRHEDDNADKIKSTLALAHLKKPRVFEENSLSSPKGLRRLSFPQNLLDIFFAFCYNARIETNFVDAVWAMRCSTRPGKISEEL